MIAFNFTATALLGAAYAVAADAPKPAAPPELNTAKYWRLNQRATALRVQLADTEHDLQQELTALGGKCGPNFMLDYQRDEKAENVERAKYAVEEQLLALLDDRHIADRQLLGRLTAGEKPPAASLRRVD